MPIIDKSRYPANWREISNERKEAVGWKCELCGAEHGKPNPRTGSKVVLTVHHIEHLEGTPEDNQYPNLIVLCQKCHLRLDLGKHIRNAKTTRRKQNDGKKTAQQIRGDTLPRLRKEAF